MIASDDLGEIAVRMEALRLGLRDFYAELDKLVLLLVEAIAAAHAARREEVLHVRR